jgi:hypothetical protein
MAPWPVDLGEYLKLTEKMWVIIDGLMKKGEIKEFGYFLDGTSGYTIGEGDSTVALRDVNLFNPYYNFEVHEIIPYEKGKESLRALIKTQAEIAKK